MEIFVVHSYVLEEEKRQIIVCHFSVFSHHSPTSDDIDDELSSEEVSEELNDVGAAAAMMVLKHGPRASGNYTRWPVKEIKIGHFCFCSNLKMTKTRKKYFFTWLTNYTVLPSSLAQ